MLAGGAGPQLPGDARCPRCEGRLRAARRVAVDVLHAPGTASWRHDPVAGAPLPLPALRAHARAPAQLPAGPTAAMSSRPSDKRSSAPPAAQGTDRSRVMPASRPRPFAAGCPGRAAPNTRTPHSRGACTRWVGSFRFRPRAATQWAGCWTRSPRSTTAPARCLAASIAARSALHRRSPTAACSPARGTANEHGPACARSRPRPAQSSSTSVTRTSSSRMSRNNLLRSAHPQVPRLRRRAGLRTRDRREGQRAGGGAGGAAAPVVEGRARRDGFLPSLRRLVVLTIAGPTDRGGRPFCRDSVRCCCLAAKRMDYSRQVVLLPGGVAYWTVLDGSFERVQPFDDFLRYLRLDRGRVRSAHCAPGARLRLARCRRRHRVAASRSRTRRLGIRRGSPDRYLPHRSARPLQSQQEGSRDRPCPQRACRRWPPVPHNL